MNKTELFEEKILQGLKDSGCTVNKELFLMAAVSGGADSISLLTALHSLKVQSGFSLEVITVNHNLRPVNETSGDADFVEEYCSSLGIVCHRHEIERGKILQLAESKKIGIEAAARNLRYECFNKEVSSSEAKICLAHNQNDFLETEIMRFLQGADSRALSSIPQVNGNFIRPMLGIERREIEEYLSIKGVKFRTDSTNFENDMLRNRVRNILVPELDRFFPGWKTGVMGTARKLKDENQVMEIQAGEAFCKAEFKAENLTAVFNRDAFNSFPQAIKRRLILEAVKKCGARERLSSGFMDELFSQVSKTETFSLNASGLEFSGADNKVYIKKSSIIATESSFFATIDSAGEFLIGDRKFMAEKLEGAIRISSGESQVTLPDLEFPFVFRSRSADDRIKCAGGQFRSVSKIFDDWKCSSMRNLIPVIQQISCTDSEGNLPLVCIWGSLYDFKDWIVK